jgi:hypothetical protein
MTKLKWFISEVIAMYSDTPSFFSKKRVESGIAFLTAMSGMIWFLIEHKKAMTTGDVVLWAGSLFVIAGYTVNQIQKEKEDEKPA